MTKIDYATKRNKPLRIPKKPNPLPNKRLEEIDGVTQCTEYQVPELGIKGHYMGDKDEAESHAKSLVSRVTKRKSRLRVKEERKRSKKDWSAIVKGVRPVTYHWFSLLQLCKEQGLSKNQIAMFSGLACWRLKEPAIDSKHFPSYTEGAALMELFRQVLTQEQIDSCRI